MKPSEVRITQLSPTLVVNREARFQCSTIGARPQARVYFLFNGLRKDVKLNCKPDSQCLAVLTMMITKEMNGASLRCVAENPRILKSEITDNIKLDVQCESIRRLLFSRAVQVRSQKLNCYLNYSLKLFEIQS